MTELPKPQFTDAQLTEYGLTRHQYSEIARYMNANYNLFENSTELAENCACDMEHDEWLDGETHPIWELAAWYILVD